MNKHLQAILNLLQHAESLTSGERKVLADAVNESDKELTITQFKLERTEKVKRTTAILLEETIAELEQKRKSVEAQNRELEIEAALERIRARAMAMHTSSELIEVANVLREQMRLLDTPELETSAVLIYHSDQESWDSWYAFRATNDPEGKIKNGITTFSKDSCEFAREIVSMYQSASTDYTLELRGAKREEWLEVLMKAAPEIAENAISTETVTFDTTYFHFSNFHGGSLLTVSYSPALEEIKTLQRRAASVFGLAYQRFRDLQKAEAQTRESQIQLALERVRSRSMAMHRSEEISEILGKMYTELTLLDVVLNRVLIWIFHPEEKYIDWWAANPEAESNAESYRVDYTDHPVFKTYLEAWEKRVPLLLYTLGGEMKASWEDHLFKNTELPRLPETVRNGMRSESKIFTTSAISDYGLLMAGCFEPFSAESNDIIQRFGRVFQQCYTRYLDVQKAEAQAREAQIEAALEKVRSRSLAMHKSEEMAFVVDELFLRMKDLEIGFDSVNILEFKEDAFQIWAAYQPGKFTVTKIPFSRSDIPYVRTAVEAKNSGQQLFTHQYLFEEKNQFLKYLFEETHFKNLPDDRKEHLLQSPCYTVSIGFAKNTAIQLQSYSRAAFSEHENALLRRFVSVFEQSYTRFLDLQKAEAQTREAQIEAGLERVRSRTMAMQRSEELLDVASVMFEQVKALGVPQWNCGFNIWNIGDKEFTYYPGSPDGKILPITCQIPLTEHPVFRRFDESRKRGDDLLIYEKQGEEQQDHYRYMLSLPGVGDFLRSMLDAGFQLPTFQIDHVANFLYGNLIFITYEHFPEMHDVFKRFAKVFEQTYTRFLDLQKAEAQAREAQIEASLERVRSKTMAMHNSQDVGDTVATLFDELKKLGVKTNRCGILIFSVRDDTEVWTAKSTPSGEATLIIGHLNVAMHPLLSGARNSWKNKEGSFSYELIGDDLINYYRAINNHPDYPIRVNLDALPSKENHTEFHFQDGAVFAFTSEPITVDDGQIFKRMSGVFGQTYRRYLDLLKAEAQAKEATIEAGLERVRGKALAMHNSNDLIATASLVFTELRKLGITSLRSGVGLLTKENRKIKLYSATSSAEGDSLSVVGWAVLDDHPVLIKMYDSWIANEDYYPVLKGEEIKTYYEKVVSNFSVPVAQSKGLEQHGYFLPFSEGLFYGWSEKHYSEAEIKILHRFKAIVDLTFRRYIEFQKSEANAIEAIRQASLDRVRAEIASMRTTSDLDRITPLIWKELNILGIPFVRCGVFIMDGIKHQIHTFLSTPDGKAIAAFHLRYDTPGNIGEILRHWMDKQMYISHWDETAFNELGEQLVQQGAIPSKEVYTNTVPPGGIYLHCLPFMQGMLYVGNTSELKQDDIQLIQSVADAFSTAYARYEDFNKLESAKAQIEKTLADLKQTQTQLVQSEKMASLGELTAGIAHEIQNPLNFVNNFSEVNKELLAEMSAEIDKGNFKEVRIIANDVINNEEKITHHGKRADAIVKSMLQHTASGSGVKEATDINALADEFLRLAYHGLRAKDKLFNASMKTDFDESIGSIIVVRQDVGRVILNLVTNAFYVVNEKRKRLESGYEPTVAVSTRRNGEEVFISIKDNGNGISQKVLDKIFQPFFTTKPTGQGTGLGLSLSYDIVKAHGGELQVQTTEGEGSEFIVTLPI